VTVVELHALDELLGRCEAAAAAMGANLLALEETPAFVLIRHTTFSGVTAQRFGTALAEAPALWERAAAYAAAVGRARALRDEQRRPSGDRIREIEQLLTGPSAIDPAAGANATVSMSGRNGGVTLAELSNVLDASYAAVTEAVRTIDACWQQQLPAVQAMNERLQRARADALALQLDPAHELRDLPERVRTALGDATADPVGHERATHDLAIAVDQLTERLASLTAQRDHIDADLATARNELVALRLLVARGARSRERARMKVHDASGLRAPLGDDVLDAPAPAGLGAELDRVERITGPWLDQRRALDAWTARARDVHAEAQAIARANEAPVAARDELRGRLESYRAMAGAHGAAEDAALGELYERAHAALHTAPADLRAAAPLVVQYVAAVRARAGARKETT
jgi:hypothetical protein